MPAASTNPFTLTHNTEVRHRCTLTFEHADRPTLNRPANGRVVIDKIVFGKVGSGRLCLLDLVSWDGHTVFPDGRVSATVRTGACAIDDFAAHDNIVEAHAQWVRRRSLLAGKVVEEASVLIANADIIGGSPGES